MSIGPSRGRRTGAATLVAALVALVLATVPIARPAAAIITSVDAGGPYLIAEGDQLVLDGSTSAGTLTTFHWDLDNDGQYDDVAGEITTVDWRRMVELGLGDDGTYTIGLEVSDGVSTGTASASLVIGNAPPAIEVRGSSAVAAGSVHTIEIVVDDPGNDTVSGWTVAWGDGAVTTGSGAPTTASHTYGLGGITNDILVSVTDEDGTWSGIELAVPLYDATERVVRIDADSGTIGSDYDGSGGALVGARAVAVGPDGLLYVSSFSTNRIVRFDPSDGSFDGTFVSAGSGGLTSPKGLLWSREGTLLVVSAGTAQVLEYDADTGAFLGVFASVGLSSPSSMAHMPGGDLLVADQTNDNIIRFDGLTGAYIGVFATAPASSLPADLTYGPDGHVYVAYYSDSIVARFDGASGASMGTFATVSGGNPVSVDFGPDGHLWVSDYWAERIVRFDGTTGAALGDRVALSAPAGPMAPAFVPTTQVAVVEPFVVNNVGDAGDANVGSSGCETSTPGQCTLRAAIEEANAASRRSLITFDLPGGGPWTITPGSALPSVSNPVTIDARTQPGWLGAPVVRVDGPSAGASNGLSINAADVEIRGLSVTGFAQVGVFTSGSATVIAENWIGVAPGGGDTDNGNGGLGVMLDADDGTVIDNLISANDDNGMLVNWGRNRATIARNVIGLTAAGDATLGNGGEGIEIGTVADARLIDNVISGNSGQGIGVYGVADGLVLQGNMVGTGSDGITVLGGQPQNILILAAATNATIGGHREGDGNVIAGATWEGLLISDPSAIGIAIVGNNIFGNGLLGIELGNDGTDTNDAGDVDSGTNGHLNHPEPTGAVSVDGVATIDFALDVAPGTYRVDAFENPNGVDASGNGEGEVYLGAGTVVHTGSGAETFQLRYPAAAGAVLTLTTTEAGGGSAFGSTSEFSVPVTAVEGGCTDVDSDGLCGVYEAQFGDTDGDTNPNEQDSDDDGDARPTVSENADPNGDGDGRDALDSDRDGVPDWLDQPNTAATDAVVVSVQKISDAAGDFGPALGDGDRFGAGTAAIGDVNGDGVVDLFVGAVGDDDGSGSAGAGYVLFLDSAGRVQSQQKISAIEGAFTGPLGVGDTFGESAAGIGDINGDGIPDLAVGAVGDDDGAASAGAVYILFLDRDGSVKGEQKISASSGGLTGPLSASDYFHSVAGLGDVNGDGINDIAVGAYGDDDGGNGRGAVYVLMLAADGSVAAEQKISSTVGGLGDVIADNERFGRSIAGIGDVDGDGVPDLAVGADGANSSQGAVFVVLLASDGSVKGHQRIDAITGGLGADLDNSDYFGIAVGATGDLDGDGTPDVAVGAPGDDDGASAQGAVHVLFLDATGAVHDEQKISGVFGNLPAGLETIDYFGSSVAGLGDLDGDGAIDIAVGAEYDDDGGNSRGAIYNIFLREDAPTTTAVVNSTADSGDANPGDHVCQTSTAGECTLRAAIEEANASTAVDRIAFAIPQTDAGYTSGPDTFTFTPATPYPVITDEVVIDGSTQSEFVDLPVIVLDGSAASGYIVALELGLGSGPSAISDLTIHSFDQGLGIEDSHGHVVTGLVVGLRRDGVTTAGNTWGVYADSSRYLTFGGTNAGDRNVIAGNSYGLALYNESNHARIQGNYIGTDTTGLLDRGHVNDGLFIVNGSSYAQVGGSGPGEANVIAGNGSSGVYIGSGAMVAPVVEGNLIGLGADGVTPLANDQDGVELGWGSQARVVGNRFGPHGQSSLSIANHDDAVVQGNLIGTDLAGTATWASTGAAVFVGPGADRATIGGTGVGEGNVIANGGAGGVVLDVAAGQDNRVVGNAISGNVGLGIDLGSDGVTRNDADDADTGPNGLQNHPVISEVIESAPGTLTLTFTLDAEAGTHEVHVYANPGGSDPTGSGEAEEYRGADSVVLALPGESEHTMTVPGAAGDVISLTAGLVNGSNAATSELSPVVVAGGPGTFFVNSTRDVADAGIDGVCATGGTNSVGAAECTLRAALAEANANADVTEIHFAIPPDEPGFVDGGADPHVWTIAPISALPTVVESALIDATTQAGWAARPAVELDGSSAGSGVSGLRVDAASSEVRGFAFHSFDANGLSVEAAGNDLRITASSFGIDATGAVARPNGGYGVLLDAGSGPTVIGGADADRNVISGNTLDGVRVLSSTGNIIENNLIGTDATGLLPVPNGEAGVALVGTASANAVGQPGLGNVISGNLTHGVISTASGAANRIEGNIIGLGSDGLTVVANAGDGVRFFDGARQSFIGGKAADAGNTISGNGANGISIDGNGNGVTNDHLVVGNRIGTDTAESVDIGNTGHGIRVAGGASAVVIGDPSTVNVIAGNGRHGVQVEGTGTAAAVVGNVIRDNADLGVDLVGGVESIDGVTANDPGDGDTGPNELLNAPQITAATVAGGSANATLQIDVPAGDYRIDLYANPSGADPSGYGEAEDFLATVTHAHGGSGPESVPVVFSGTAGLELTATTTLLSGSTTIATSEISAAVVLEAEAVIVVNSTGDAADASTGDELCDTGGDNSEGATECTLRAAIEEANASASIDTIQFAIPASDAGATSGAPDYWTVRPASAVLPAVTAPLTIDAITQDPGAGQPVIQLDGSSRNGTDDGLWIAGNGVTLRGFSFTGWPDDGLFVNGPDTTVVENWFGVAPDGSTVANASTDVVVGVSTDATIGGSQAGDGNVFAGAGNDDGLIIYSSSGTLVENNWFGVAADGSTALGALGEGVHMNYGSTDTVIHANHFGWLPQAAIVGFSDATAMTVTGNVFGTDDAAVLSLPVGSAVWHGGSGDLIFGGPDPSDANLVRNTLYQGVTLDAAATGTLSAIGNSIAATGSLAIDLGGDGVSANDPLDADSGPNGMLNTPEIRHARVSGATVTVDLDLDVPAGSYRLEIFANPGGADPTGYGELETLMGAFVVAHAGGGPERFTVTVPGAVGDILTATATESSPTYGPTSEPSAAHVATAASSTTVNSTGDGADASLDGRCDTGTVLSDGSAECTLRAAIEEVNGTAEVDTIRFDVPTADAGHDAGVWTIAPGNSWMPDITATVDIDATTQPGYVGTPVIVLDGSSAPLAGGADDDGLELFGDDSVVRGLSIVGWADEGINVRSDRVQVSANWLGVHPDGAIVANDRAIEVAGDDVIIGGPLDGDGNVIDVSGSGGVIIGSSSANTVVQHNHVGVGADGMAALGTATAHGLQIDGSAVNTTVSDNQFGNLAAGAIRVGGSTASTAITGNFFGTDAAMTAVLPIDHALWVGDSATVRFGGTTPTERNTVRNVAGDAVVIDAAATGAVSILGNSIAGSVGLGIDLEGGGEDVAGVTANDPGDSDTGPNGLLNHPVIGRVQRVAGDLVVDLELDVPAGDYRIELFANGAANASGSGEGEDLLGAATVTHTGSGTEPFRLTATSPATILTATVTADFGAGSFGATSEFSFAVPSPDLVIVNSPSDEGDIAVGDGQCDTGLVNSDGVPACTLRAAIEEANFVSTPVDTIWFAVPGADADVDGSWTIGPLAALPPITDETTIDATTQPGWVDSPVVHVDGSAIGGVAPGLTLAGDDSELRGVSIGGFPATAVVVSGLRSTLANSWIGVAPDGAANPNGDVGVSITGDDAVVGGTDSADRNVVAHNGGAGIEVASAVTDPAVLGNSIFDNGGLAIDHDGDGPTANDVGDLDATPNAPTIVSAVVNGAAADVDLSLDRSAGTYLVEVFTNPNGPDPSGFGEAEVLVGSTTVVHPGAGPVDVALSITVGAGARLSATATEMLPSAAATSEMSATVLVSTASTLRSLDSSARRSDLTASGIDPTSTEPAPGGAAVRAGGGGARLVGPALTITDGALTLGATFRADAVGGSPRIVSKRDGAGNPIMELWIDSGTGEMVSSLRIGGAPVEVRGATIAAGTWHDVAVVWDGVAVVLYVDGIEVDRTAAGGAIATDTNTPFVIGAVADGSSSFQGLVDEVTVSHAVTGVDAIVARARSVISPATAVTVGAAQNGVAGAWTVSGAQARSGGGALVAPTTDVGSAPAWAVATGLSEPGVAYESWWWVSDTTGVDLAAGTRAGAAPTDELEAGFVGAAGWELRQRSGASSAVDASAAGTVASGTWVKVEVWTDQLGRTRLVVDGIEVAAWTDQSSSPLTDGSIALRAGVLPTGATWYVDDVRARKLITPEPIATVGPLDRN